MGIAEVIKTERNTGTICLRAVKCKLEVGAVNASLSFVLSLIRSPPTHFRSKLDVISFYPFFGASMVILRDGEKYACEGCMKGHRVTGCNHFDRPLVLIKKKGRPVKQCSKCRQERKTLNRHKKCTCEAQNADVDTVSEEETTNEQNDLVEKTSTDKQKSKDSQSEQKESSPFAFEPTEEFAELWRLINVNNEQESSTTHNLQGTESASRRAHTHEELSEETLFDIIYDQWSVDGDVTSQDQSK